MTDRDRTEQRSKTALERDIERQLGGSRSLEGAPKVPYYKVESDGNNHAFRVMPGDYGESKELWFLGIEQHWVKKDGNRIPLFCPKMDGHDCPFCELLTEYREKEKDLKDTMKSSEVKADKARLKELEFELKLIQKVASFLAPRPSYMMNVVDRDDQRVRVFSSPKTVFTKIMNYFSQDGPEIFDIDTGHDFRISKKKKGRSYDYDLSLAPKPVPIGRTPADTEDLLDKRHDLTSVIRFEEEDKLTQFCKDGVKFILEGNADDDDDDNRSARNKHDDEDDRQTYRSSRRDQGGESSQRSSRRDDVEERPRRGADEDDRRESTRERDREERDDSGRGSYDSRSESRYASRSRVEEEGSRDNDRREDARGGGYRDDDRGGRGSRRAEPEDARESDERSSRASSSRRDPFEGSDPVDDRRESRGSRREYADEPKGDDDREPVASGAARSTRTSSLLNRMKDIDDNS